MIPARDRQLRLTIYNTQADIDADTNGTNITSGIYESSANLEHTFFTVLPGWGEANASMFTCDLADAPDLTGKYIRVWVLAYATEAATTRTSNRVFAGKIDSCRYDKYKASRALEAYDRLYELRKVDISEWWNTWVQTLTEDTVSLPSVVAAMCTQYGVTNSASIPEYITGTAPLKARKMGACSFVQMLGYIGEICGGYFSMQDGPLRFVDMRNVNGTAAQESADGNLDTQLTEIDDADTAPYTQVTIYEGSDIVYSNGSGKNLAITDNPFLTGQTPATINSWGVNIYANVTRMAGRPATLALAYSQPQAEWSRITSAVPFILTTTDEGTTRRHIVSGYSFSGSGLIDETISCTGEMREGASYSAQQNAMLSELTDLGTQLTFKVNADAVIEAVNLEAQGGVTINAEAIDINGVVSANNGFKINTDGSMETIAGKIGGWEIDADKLKKTDLETDPNTQQVIHDYSLALSPHEKVLSGTSNASTEEVNKGSIDVYAWGTIIKKGETLNQMVYSKASFVQPVTTEYNNSIEISRKVKQRSGGDGEWHDYGKSIVDRTGLEVYTDQIDPYANQPVKTAQIDATGVTTYDTSGNVKSVLKNDVLKVNERDLLKEFCPMTNYFATQIPANANLNTTTYLQIGSYYATPNATVQTFTNCPTDRAFLMTVQLTNNSDLDITGTTYRYILRTIYTYNGEVWFQYVGSGATAGAFTYNAWVKLRGSLATGNVIKQTETTGSGRYSVLLSESERSTSDATESTRKSYGLTYNPSDGSLRVDRYHTGTSNQFSYTILGNDTASGTAGAVAGVLRIYGQKSLYAQIYDKNNALTAHRSIALQDKDGELPVLEDGVFDAGNRNIQITGADTGRSASIRTKAGGIVYLTYFANGNHGVYSSGYETDVTDSSTYTSGNKWIIRRNSAGNVYVDEWGSIGAAGRPVYFNSSGRPTAVTEETGSGTRNTTTTTGGTCSYVKQGKIVSVTAYGVALRAGVVDGNNLFTGLPAAAAEHHVGFPCVNAGSQTDYTGIEAYVDTSGNLKFKRGGTLNGKYYAASFTYFAAS